MQVSERWSISGTNSDFVLTEHVVRKSKGVEKPGTKQTYHPSLEQCLAKIVKSETLSLVEAASVASLISALDNLKQDIKDIAHAAEVTLSTDSQTQNAAD